MESLYVRVEKTPEDTIKSFIYKFAIARDSYVGNGRFYTYSDPECTIGQCCGYRSLEIYERIVKTYFPESTLQDVVDAIKELILEGTKVAFLFCTSANKWILHPTISMLQIAPLFNDGFFMNYSNSINKMDSKGCGIYSGNEILEMLNLNNLKPETNQ